MLSTLKNTKSIWSMNPGENLEISVVGTLGILVALVRRQKVQGSSKSGIFFGRPSICTFIAIHFSILIETWPKLWWIIWERFCFYIKKIDGTATFLSCWELNLNFWFEYSIFFEDGRVAPKNKSFRVKKVTMFKRFRPNLLKTNIKF